MDTKASENDQGNEYSAALREYSHAQELVNNLPYGLMILLGAAIFVVGLASSVWGWIAASVYVMYGVGGTLWIMVFVCPYCAYWNTRSCPCGYGRVSARLRDKQASDRFKEKFKRHIPVIVPLWLIPVLAGFAVVVRGFSWPLLVLIVVFALDAFVLVPVFSRKHGCVSCPQRDSCPWMSQKRNEHGEG